MARTPVHARPGRRARRTPPAWRGARCRGSRPRPVRRPPAARPRSTNASTLSSHDARTPTSVSHRAKSGQPSSRRTSGAPSAPASRMASSARPAAVGPLGVGDRHHDPVGVRSVRPEHELRVAAVAHARDPDVEPVEHLPQADRARVVGQRPERASGPHREDRVGRQVDERQVERRAPWSSASARGRSANAARHTPTSGSVAGIVTWRRTDRDTEPVSRRSSTRRHAAASTSSGRSSTITASPGSSEAHQVQRVASHPPEPCRARARAHRTAPSTPDRPRCTCPTIVSCSSTHLWTGDRRARR